MLHANMKNNVRALGNCKYSVNSIMTNSGYIQYNILILYSSFIEFYVTNAPWQKKIDTLLVDERLCRYN